MGKVSQARWGHVLLVELDPRVDLSAVMADLRKRNWVQKVAQLAGAEIPTLRVNVKKEKDLDQAMHWLELAAARAERNLPTANNPKSGGHPFWSDGPRWEIWSFHLALPLSPDDWAEVKEAMEADDFVARVSQRDKDPGTHIYVHAICPDKSIVGEVLKRFVRLMYKFNYVYLGQVDSVSVVDRSTPERTAKELLETAVRSMVGPGKITVTTPDRVTVTVERPA